MKEIDVGKGIKTTVDDLDYVRKCGKTIRTIIMSREILGITSPSIHIDHRNGNKLCNERWNLRESTPSQNQANMKPRGGTSKYKGVRKRGNKWEARITQNRKQIQIGIFDTENEAAIAYNTKAVELFGEFAWINEVN